MRRARPSGEHVKGKMGTKKRGKKRGIRGGKINKNSARVKREDAETARERRGARAAQRADESASAPQLRSVRCT